MNTIEEITLPTEAFSIDNYKISIIVEILKRTFLKQSNILTDIILKLARDNIFITITENMKITKRKGLLN